MLRKTLDIYIEEVLEHFPDAKLVEVRDTADCRTEPIPWCDAFDKNLAAVREEGARRVFYANMRWKAMELGRKIGWAAVVFKERYGFWPAWDWKDTVVPMEPDDEFNNWFRRREAKNAREFKKEKKAERAARFDADAVEAGGLEGQPGDEAEAGERADAEGFA